MANNIIVSTGEEPLGLREAGAAVTIDYNLCAPPSPLQGAHSISGDFLFVDPEHGVLWLQKGSPAIGAGARQYAEGVDFWGRPVTGEGPVDLGAFPYVEALTRPEARSGWHHGWAYEYAPGEGQRLPDLWRLPQIDSAGR